MPNTELAEVMSNYTAPWRQYHGIHHPVKIIELLKLLYGVDQLSKWALDFAWYHDAILIPGRDDNEEKSAELFATHVQAKGGGGEPYVFASSGEQSTYDAILATKNHFTAPVHPILDVCLDADLAIIGSSSEEYLEYCFGVEAEVISYFNVILTGDKRMDLRDATEAYLSGRQKFIINMLDYMESGNLIYRTPNAKRLWEEAAYVNVLAEHETLSKRLKRIQ